jgi:NADP-dependent alcohol dehydrogenase
LSKRLTKPKDFFRELGLPVRFADVDLDSRAIAPILQQLKDHNMVTLGEHRSNDLTVSERILNQAL